MNNMKILKWVLIGLFVLTIGGGIYYLLQNKKEKEQVADDDFYASYTDSAGKVHQIQVKRAVSSLGDLVNSFAGFESPASAGTFPYIDEIDDSKFKASDRNYWANFISNTLVNRFDSYVVNASKLTKVPRWMIYGIMVIEIKPETLEYSTSASGARGVGQIMKITATDTIVVANKLKNLDPQHEDIFRRIIGDARTDKIYKAVDTYDRSLVEIGKGVYKNAQGKYENDLYNPELNIHLMALKLANLLDIYGVNDLASVIVAYNKGDATPKTKYGIAGKSLKQALAATSGEAHGYIVRALGRHGAFDIVTNSVGIID